MGIGINAARNIFHRLPHHQTGNGASMLDDLNPALAAVVSGDATAEEAIEGVRRGWRRLTRSVP